MFSLSDCIILLSNETDLFKLGNLVILSLYSKATNGNVCVCLNSQTMKREKPKPITGGEQTEEIVLTKGTKGKDSIILLYGA